MSGGKDEITLGYRYYFDIIMGLARNVDGIAEIRVGDVKVFPKDEEYDPETSLEPMTPGLVVGAQGGTAMIDAGDAFGGDEGEGGIEGRLFVTSGWSQTDLSQAITQASPAVGLTREEVLSASSEADPNGPVPGYKRAAVAHYSGLVCSMNPYPKPWAFRLRRTRPDSIQDQLPGVDPVIYLSNGRIKAMNPACILFECVSNSEWGRSLRSPDRSRPLSDYRTNSHLIDIESFQHAAAVFVQEGFGLCIVWKRDGDLDAFAQQIIDHVGGVLYPDPYTGKLTFRLIRDNYDLDNIPIFSRGNGLLSITDNSNAMGSALINEVIVIYTDPITNEERQVREQSLSSIHQQKAIYSTTSRYPAVPTGDLAARLAKRDLNSKATPNLRRLTITVDRRGYWIVPGSVIRIHEPSLNIYDIAVRVGEVSDTESGAIRLKVVQDVFGLPKHGTITPPSEGHRPPPNEPHPAEFWDLLEVPYAELARRMDHDALADVAPSDSYLMGKAAQPATGRNMNYRMVSGRTTALVDKVIGDWAEHFTLKAAQPDRAATMFLLPRSNRLSAGQLLLIGQEYVQVTALGNIDQQANTVEVFVNRGCLDTIPVLHTEGEDIWMIRSATAGTAGYAAQRTPYVKGDTVRGKVLPRSMTGQVNAALVPTKSVVMEGRQDKPYAPGRVRLNNTPLWRNDLVVGDAVFTWNGRNRVTQHSTITGQEGAHITPEEGAVYVARVYNADDNTVLKEMTSETERTFTFSEADSADKGSPRNVRFELYSERDGVRSLMTYSHTFEHVATGADIGWGFDYGNNFGG